MAIKNKNLMMSLTESLNENKKQEIANFKKLKEATEDNISYVTYLLDTAEDMDDVQQAIYQIDDGDLENEVQLMFDSCSEDDSLEEVISLVVSTMEDNAEYDEEMNESDESKKFSPISYADFDFEEGSLIDKNFGDDYEDATYEGYWIDIYYKGTHIGRVFKEISDGWVMYIELDYDGVDKAFEGIVPNISASRNENFRDDSYYRSVKAFLNSLITKMGSSLGFDAPASDIDDSDDLDESNEYDRKNTLIAKKDELEARLGDILQSIKDKQMDTEEFRKLSREAADLDSEIMDLDNQIHGVYESVNEAELFNMDEYKDLADEDDSVNIKELKMIQDYAVRKTKEIINYVYYNAPYSGIGDNILNDMLNVIKESLPNMNESINESDEDVKKGIVDQLISTGMTKEQAEQTANDICHIFKNKVGSNQVVNEDINPDGFSNDENLQQYFKDLKNLPDEVEIDNVKYKMEQYGGSGDNCYAIYTDINNNDSYIKVFYSLNKTENGSYKGISKINGVSDLRESAKPVKEGANPNEDLASNVYKEYSKFLDSADKEESNDGKYTKVIIPVTNDKNGTMSSDDIQNTFSILKDKFKNDGWNIFTGTYNWNGKSESVPSDSFVAIKNNESAKPIKEAAITEKNLLKSQGNVYMFECKGNSDFSHIVGENYNEEENTLENVETYNNKEDADKDYLDRCEITTESQKPRDIEDGLDESDDGSYDYEELWVQLPETFTAFVRNEIEDAVGGDLSDFMDLTAQDILDSYNENYGEEIYGSEEELEDEEESYNYLGYIESRLNDAKQKAGVDKLDSDSYKVKSYHVENMGGGTMAIFGQLEDGRYFAGNEDGLNFYDIDVWPYHEKDTSEEEFQQLEKDHNIGSIDSIDNRFEYEKIISQTNF